MISEILEVRPEKDGGAWVKERHTAGAWSTVHMYRAPAGEDINSALVNHQSIGTRALKKAEIAKKLNDVIQGHDPFTMTFEISNLQELCQHGMKILFYGEENPKRIVSNMAVGLMSKLRTNFTTPQDRANFLGLELAEWEAMESRFDNLMTVRDTLINDTVVGKSRGSK